MKQSMNASTVHASVDADTSETDDTQEDSGDTDTEA